MAAMTPQASETAPARVITREGESLIRMALSDLAAQLDAEVFWQIHRGMVVNVNEVASTRRDLGGRVFVKLRDGKTELSVSRACSDPLIPIYNFGMSAPIRVVLNGAPREFPVPLTFAQLLQEMALAGRRLAVERNGEIVPRSRFGEARVADGDRIEVVIAVGGG
jgi:sulfur carrier protein